MLNPVHGSLNPLLHATVPGFPPDFSWLSSPTLAFPSVILANVWRGYPLVMVMLLAGLMAIPRELYEAAAVDGAGRVSRFLHVTLPGLRTIILIALALDMVWEFRRFALVMTMTGGGPGTLTEVLSTLVYKFALHVAEGRGGGLQPAGPLDPGAPDARGVRGDVAAQALRHLLRIDHSDPPERVVGQQRLDLEDVEAGPGELPGQQAGGGTWGGCVYDVDAIVEALRKVSPDP